MLYGAAFGAKHIVSELGDKLLDTDLCSKLVGLSEIVAFVFTSAVIIFT